MVDTIAGWFGWRRDYNRMNERDSMNDSEPLSRDELKRIEEEKQKESAKRRLQEAINQLQTRETNLIALHSAAERNVRRFAKQKQRQLGIGFIRKKKMYEKLLEQNRNEQLTAEKQLLNLQSQDAQMQTMSAMDEANKIIKRNKKTQKTLDPDKIQDLMMDMSEHNAENEMVNSAMTMGDDFEDEDAEEEFERLCNASEEKDTTIERVEISKDFFPSVPDEKIEKKENALDELASEIW